MKKLLIGTTALVAAGSLATGAQAADKIKMGVGGYFQALIAFGDQDDQAGAPGENRREHEIQREGEIIFSGSTKLDNGINVGAQVQLEAESEGGDDIDESYIFFSGGFGRIVIGSENSAAYLMHYAAPAGAFGLNSPNFRLYSPANPSGVGGNQAHTRGIISSRHQITSDSEKLTYFTPRIGGFQAGISYTPDSSESASSYRGMTTNTDADDQSEVIEIGVNFVSKLGGMNVAVSGGFATGTNEAPTVGMEDRTEWNVGFNVGFGGLKVGGAYRNDDGGMSGGNTALQHANLGVTYGQGAWTIGVQWVYQWLEGGADADGTIDEYTGIELGGKYVLGPGVDVRAAIQFHELDDNAPGAGGDNEATIFYIGTALSL